MKKDLFKSTGLLQTKFKSQEQADAVADRIEKYDPTLRTKLYRFKYPHRPDKNTWHVMVLHNEAQLSFAI